MTNINDRNFDGRECAPGFEAKRARIGYELGTEQIGVSVWELPPGQTAYPYHFHLSDEEVLIVLEGSPSLRTPEGIRPLEEGAAVRFPTGEAGAHQILNSTSGAVRFLAVSSSGRPDIVVYPDSNKLSATERRPAGGGLQVFFDRDSQVGYWDGEQPPETAD